jgi:hypothetical protein
MHRLRKSITTTHVLKTDVDVNKFLASLLTKRFSKFHVPNP